MMEAFAIAAGAIISFFVGAIGAMRYVHEAEGCFDLFEYAFGSVLVSLFVAPFLLMVFLIIGVFDLATATVVNIFAALFGFAIALHLAASRS